MSIQDDNFASYKLFERALKLKGYTTTVATKSPAMVTYMSPSGVTWKTRTARITYPINSENVYDIAVHKDKANELVQRAGFNVPHTLLVTDNMTDLELVKVLGMFEYLIVKPADSLQSRGLTTNINSLGSLKKAIANAQLISSRVLIQQQVTGQEIRFTVVEGKARVALLRQTARVTGDGVTSIADLIRSENEERAGLYFERISYPQLDESMIDTFLLYSDRIPQRGEVVELSSSTMVREGCSIYDVLPYVDKSYVALAESLAVTLGAGFVVVDIFCQSYMTPADSNYYFIEFNTAPALKLYYACRDGNHFDIVPLLADVIDRSLHGK